MGQAKSRGAPPFEKGETADEESLREKKRAHIAMELHQTERTYLNALESLDRLYIQPLSDNGLITPESHRLLFDGIESVIGVSRQFEQALGRRLSGWSAKSGLGDVLLPMVKYLKVFETSADICNGHAIEMCADIGMCAWTCIWTYVGHMRTCVDMCIWTWACVCSYVCTCVWAWVWTCVYGHTYGRTCGHVSRRVYVHVYIGRTVGMCLDICMDTGMDMCMNMCMPMRGHLSGLHDFHRSIRRTHEGVERHAQIQQQV